MRGAQHLLAALGATTALAACRPVGALEDNNPSSSQTLAVGQVAIDPATETIYAVAQAEQGTPSAPWVALAPAPVCPTHRTGGTPMTPYRDSYWTYALVSAIEPDTGAVRRVSAVDDPRARIVFAPAGVIIASTDRSGNNELRLVARASGEVIARQALPAGQRISTALSPDGRFLATVIAEADPNAGMSLVLSESATLASEFVACGTVSVGAAWMHGTNTLVTLEDTRVGDEVVLRTPNGIGTAATVTSRFMVQAGFNGAWWTDIWHESDPVIVSPDDRYIAFPTLGVGLVDLRTQTARDVTDARGPVSFTPDSSAVVSQSGGSLNVIDAATGTIEHVALPLDSDAAFYTTREGGSVLVGGFADDASGRSTIERLLLVALGDGHVYDLASGFDHPALQRFVLRTGHGEVWLADRFAVDRVDLATHSLTRFETSSVSGIGYLPSRDLLVLCDNSSRAITLWSPDTRSSVRRVNY